jgi:hypothetical protein
VVIIKQAAISLAVLLKRVNTDIVLLSLQEKVAAAAPLSCCGTSYNTASSYGSSTVCFV